MFLSTVIIFVIFAVRSNASTNLLHGFDCSKPQNIRDFHLDQTIDCDAHGDLDVANTDRQASYQLLQETDKQVVEGYKCTVQIDRHYQYCGVYDHSLTGSKWNLNRAPYRRLDATFCRRMGRGTFVTDKDTLFPIEMNRENVIIEETVGKTYNTASGELKCIGAPVTLDGDDGEIKQAVIVTKYYATVTTETFHLKTDGTVLALTSGEILDAEPRDEEAEGPQTIFIWKFDVNFCYLGFLQAFDAYEVPVTPQQSKTSSETLSIVMAKDDSLIRVRKQAPISKCGRVLSSTNYPALFIYPTSSPRQFTEKIHPSEVKIQTYVDNQDDFLYHHLTDQIEDQFQDLLAATCHHRSFFRASSMYLASQHPEFMSFQYRNGSFAAIAGESLYLYDCKAVIVQPLEADQCFEQLLVKNLNSTIEDPRPLFLEPLSRELTHAGVPIPCSNQFAPKFRTLSGMWIAATPSLTMARTPKALAVSSPNTQIQFEDTDFSAGGIYTDETWHKVEEFIEFKGMRRSLGAQLTHQTASGKVGTYVGPSQIFPKTTELEWTALAWGWFKGTIYKIGQIATYVMGILSILKFISYLVHVCANFPAISRQYNGNALMALFWAFNPISFLLSVLPRRRPRQNLPEDPEAPEEPQDQHPKRAPPRPNAPPEEQPPLQLGPIPNVQIPNLQMPRIPQLPQPLLPLRA